MAGEGAWLADYQLSIFRGRRRTNYYRVRDTNLAHLPDTALLPPLQRRNPLEDRRL